MLKDLKVLELASVLAGPSVGQFFAELGAEVIKVENLSTGGDVTRSWKSAGEETDDRSAYFCSVNWGKKSLAADLTTQEGKKVVLQLAQRADVVIASYKPGDATKLGVDYKALSSLNDKIIYGSISGYGPNNNRVGYDAVVQAEAGFMFMNGEADGPSLKMPVALIDVLAAHHLKEGILIGLLERQQTGKGKLVEVSLIQAAVSSLVNQASNWLVAGKLPRRQGSAHPNIAPYGDVFKMKDGEEILLAIGSDKQFSELCMILNLPHLSGDNRFSTNQHRVTHRKELNKILNEAIQKHSSKELLSTFHRAKIPAGIIQNMKQVFEMDEAKELLLQVNSLTGVRNYVGSSPSSSLLPPPQLGEHTVEILQRGGFSSL